MIYIAFAEITYDLANLPRFMPAPVVSAFDSVHIILLPMYMFVHISICNTGTSRDDLGWDHSHSELHPGPVVSEMFEHLCHRQSQPI